MTLYIQLDDRGRSRGVWIFDGNIAKRIGVNDAINSPYAHFYVKNGESFVDGARRNFPDWFGVNGSSPFHKLELCAGQYYPRIARPSDQHPKDSPGSYPGIGESENELATAQGQLAALLRGLERLSQAIHPCNQTYSVFGHDTRNLLILACTEVESHWKAVLVANEYCKSKYTTADYVKLNEAMKLHEYIVSFPKYPWMDPVCPFEKWNNSAKPTKDLEWYDAYNHVKHDRERNFQKAEFIHCFNSVAACVILICAQFGNPHGLGIRTPLSDFFLLKSVPSWAPSDVYVYPYGTKLSPVNYSFK